MKIYLHHLGLNRHKSELGDNGSGVYKWAVVSKFGWKLTIYMVNRIEMVKMINMVKNIEMVKMIKMNTKIKMILISGWQLTSDDYIEEREQQAGLQHRWEGPDDLRRIGDHWKGIHQLFRSFKMSKLVCDQHWCPVSDHWCLAIALSSWVVGYWSIDGWVTRWWMTRWWLDNCSPVRMSCFSWRYNWYLGGIRCCW